jgi:hypothetical protein
MQERAAEAHSDALSLPTRVASSAAARNVAKTANEDGLSRPDNVAGLAARRLGAGLSPALK